MELYRGAHLIELEIDGRLLYLPLLLEKDRAVLVDCGTRLHAQNEVPEYLGRLGVPSKLLEWLIITHPDPDHCGGIGAMVKRFPNLRVACGAADEILVESRESLYAARYGRFSQEHGISISEVSSADQGWWSEVPYKPDAWSGGEVLHLSSKRSLEIWHLPGHSDGHLAVYDVRYRTLFYGDALQGSGYQSSEGKWVLCPIYTNAQSYLETIRRVEGSQAASMVGCHWPVLRGSKEIRRFSAQSREFVERSECRIQDYLTSHPAGATLRELCNALGSQLGSWPSSVNIRLAFAFLSNLQRAVSKGTVVIDSSVHPVVFRRA